MYGKDMGDLKEIGIKWDFIFENKELEEHEFPFLKMNGDDTRGGLDEPFNGQKTDFGSELDISDLSAYRDNGGKLPFLHLHTPVTKDELVPMPDNYNLRHNEVHWELERWTVF
mmetsp:Transcript_16074/g.27138  ORF Transcript_16074/g.27138 Transcript_16074/m.27138 type:complete len:113 (-) Transcript_16074:910-1248(-)